MAVDLGARRLVEVPWAKVTGGFDEARRSGIGQIRSEVHGLADAGGVELEPAKLKLHRLTAGILTQNVKLGVVGINLVDDEVGEMNAMFGLRRKCRHGGAITLRCNLDHKAVQFEPSEMNRRPQQLEDARTYGHVLNGDQRRQIRPAAVGQDKIVSSGVELGQQRDVQVLQLNLGVVVLTQGQEHAALQIALQRRRHGEQINEGNRNNGKEGQRCPNQISYGVACGHRTLTLDAEKLNYIANARRMPATICSVDWAASTINASCGSCSVSNWLCNSAGFM